MLINEAADAVFWGVASADDVDRAMKGGVNYPKGLLEWAEEVGLDRCVRALDDLKVEYGEERYRCSPLLRRCAEHSGVFQLIELNSPSRSLRAGTAHPPR